MRHPHPIFSFALSLLLVVWLTGPAAGESTPGVEVALQPPQITLGSAASLTITVQDAEDAQVELPQVAGLNFRHKGKMHQSSWINGKTSTAITLTFAVFANGPGNYTIPPIAIQSGGQKLFSAPLSLTVSPVSGGQGQGDQGTGEDLAFLQVSGTGEYYPGQSIPMTIRAFFKADYRIEKLGKPIISGDGVIMEDPGEPAPSREKYQGRMYQVFTWQTRLSGIKAGKHPLGFTVDASLLLPSRRNSGFFGGSLFSDPLIDSFFGGFDRYPLQLHSDPQTLSVLDFPSQGQPADFSGAVGSFELVAEANPTKVQVGEPISLKIGVLGEGNFDRVSPPTFPASTQWKTYPPTVTSTGSDQKWFEQAIIAQSPQVASIPPFTFSYFDPQQKQYVTVTSQAISVAVQSVPASVPAVAPEPEEISAPQKQKAAPPVLNLAPLKLSPDPPVATITPVYLLPWFLTLTATCLLLLLALLLEALVRRCRNLSPEMQLRQEMRRQLAIDLALINDSMLDSDAFLASCRKLIRQQFGARLGRTSEAISQQDLVRHLGQDHPLSQLLSLSEAATYGQVRLSPAEIERWRQILAEQMEALP